MAKSASASGYYENYAEPIDAGNGTAGQDHTAGGEPSQLDNSQNEDYTDDGLTENYDVIPGNSEYASAESGTQHDEGRPEQTRKADFAVKRQTESGSDDVAVNGTNNPRVTRSEEEWEERKENGFDFKDDAAREALDRYNPLSIDEDREYTGWIYSETNTKTGEVKWFYSRAAKGEIGMDEGPVEDCYTGRHYGFEYKVTGHYHTHGNYGKKDPNNLDGPRIATGIRKDAPGFDNFSQGDVDSWAYLAAYNRNNKLRSQGAKPMRYYTDGDFSFYLGTPSGVYMKIDYRLGIRSKNSAKELK
jgi:hypothetical protein